MEALTKMKLNCSKMNKLQLRNDYKNKINLRLLEETLHTRGQHPQQCQ